MDIVSSNFVVVVVRYFIVMELISETIVKILGNFMLMVPEYLNIDY